MQIIIHRGTHQIGGIATEIRTVSTRILIDMGEVIHPRSFIYILSEHQKRIDKIFIAI
jgi:hypothetical protein